MLLSLLLLLLLKWQRRRRRGLLIVVVGSRQSGRQGGCALRRLRLCGRRGGHRGLVRLLLLLMGLRLGLELRRRRILRLRLIVGIRRRETGEKWRALGTRKRWLRGRQIATPVIATVIATAAIATTATIVDIAIVIAAIIRLVATADCRVEFSHRVIVFARTMRLLRLRLRPMSDAREYKA